MKLYGVVEWLNGKPTIDGMECFEDKNKALERVREIEEHIRKHKELLGEKVEITIVRIYKWEGDYHFINILTKKINKER